jgi:hypothetical protein
VGWACWGASEGALDPKGPPCRFGLTAAAPVRVGHTRQARRSRPGMQVRHSERSEESRICTGRDRWRRVSWTHRIGGMSRQAPEGADVAEWQTLQT